MTSTTYTYFSFTQNRVIKNTSLPQEELYVLGEMQNDIFVPIGDISGNGKLGASGLQGWFEFSSLKFMNEQTSRPPFAPFVKGTMTSQGFSPAQRKIIH